MGLKIERHCKSQVVLVALSSGAGRRTTQASKFKFASARALKCYFVAVVPITVDAMEPETRCTEAGLLVVDFYAYWSISL